MPDHVKHDEKTGRLHNRPVREKVKMKNYKEYKKKQYIDPKTGKLPSTKKEKKDGMPMKYGKGPHMNYSAAEMEYSPAQNHHYGTRKGESIKQEKYNLMHDDPVAKDASGGRDMSWMSKHSKSAMMMKGSMEMEDKGSPAGKHCM